MDSMMSFPAVVVDEEECAGVEESTTKPFPAVVA